MISRRTREKISAMGRTPILDRESLAEILTVLYRARQIDVMDIPDGFVVYDGQVMEREDCLESLKRQGYSTYSEVYKRCAGGMR